MKLKEGMAWGGFDPVTNSFFLRQKGKEKENEASYFSHDYCTFVWSCRSQSTVALVSEQQYGDDSQLEMDRKEKKKVES